jgi:hypothetical protein
LQFMNAITTPLPDVPLPAGATVAGEWNDTAFPDPWRVIHGPDRSITDHDVCVAATACQHADGRLSDVAVRMRCFELNSDQARELAAALLEAAAEIEGWAK